MKNITEAQYDQLCDACDALLQNNANSFERNANAFLHVIREHPIFLNVYSAVFNKNGVSFFIHLIKLLFLNIIIGSYKLFHSIYRYYFLGDKLIKDKRRIPCWMGGLVWKYTLLQVAIRPERGLVNRVQKDVNVSTPTT